jgi:hypothetical protein
MIGPIAGATGRSSGWFNGRAVSPSKLDGFLLWPPSEQSMDKGSERNDPCVAAATAVAEAPVKGTPLPHKVGRNLGYFWV